ncbi:penicillin-binding transpeptidase domain-containing protein [Liquorilactobacillus oeni]|uniref:Penicillin binding protein 2B n=1 Tax=Liquorilactobacillus oeni DSM 19972 TaxID=1423777 RepID=A0A0R1M9Q9_9LACO|nr:penicillin-binding transpeptidase domain-containing protein [Liquorilactobacillus oeni]KRL04673.1 penicillin binding protein 2B [Liquorilactobacillus oeni DSM 19972]
MSRKYKRQIDRRTQQTNRKLYGRGIFFVVALLFALFIGRFFYIATFKSVNNVNLPKKAAQLYASKSEVKAQRGTIYDSDNQPIAEDTSTYTVYIILSKTAVAFGKREYLADSEKNKAAKVLSNNLSIGYDQVKKILNPADKDTYQVELGNAGKNISLETKKKIEDAGLPGINFKESQARLYPNGVFASHIIGLAENESNKMVGVMGLEKVFNTQLSGVNGVRSFEKDVRGTPIPGSKVKTRKAKNGDNVYTTIDSRLQTYLETLMTQAQDKYNPQTMSAVLMDPHTGEIKAASQRPTFNAQTKDGVGQIWRNILVEDGFEPGSTMKVLTMSAAIDSGIYNSNSTFKSGTYKIDGKMVDDWDTNGWGNITYRDAFIRSSNVGMAHLEQQMGAKRWLSYIHRFGLLSSTDSGLLNETKGSIEYKYPIEQANTAYGQGINVSVFQMIQAFSAVANNGKMVKPQIVKKVVNPNTGKTVTKIKTKVVGQPIKKATAKKVLSMMQDVVYNQNGTGSAFKIDGYPIAVKTGTGQIGNSSGTGYLTGDTNYTFSVVGVAPANDPQYVLYLVMKQPKTFANNTSGQMLASVFNPLMKRALDEKKESVSSSNNQVVLKNEVGKNAASVRKELSNSGLLVVEVGSGKKILAQSESQGSVLLSGERIIIMTGGEKTMPDITGWSRSDVAKLGKLLGIEFDFSGSGYVSSQSVAANKSLVNVSKVAVQLN